MCLARRKIKKRQLGVREFSEFEEVNSFRTQRPIGPASGIDVAEDFGLVVAALQRHAPDAVLLIFRIIKVASVKRLDRRDPSVLRQLQRGSALYRSFPDLKRF